MLNVDGKCADEAEAIFNKFKDEKLHHECFSVAKKQKQSFHMNTFSHVLSPSSHFSFHSPSSFLSCLLHLHPLSSFFLPSPLLSSSSISQLIPWLKGLGGNPSQFSSLRAPIKKGLACVICQTIVPSPSSFDPALLFLVLLPAPLSPSKSFQPDLS